VHASRCESASESLDPGRRWQHDRIVTTRKGTVLFVVPPGVHLLDLAGPAQVFSTADELGGAYRLSYAGTGDAVSHQGLRLAVDEGWPELGREDLVVVAGWRVGKLPVTRALPADVLDRIAAHHERGGRVASVCAGAFALADACLLDGRRATTHHDLQDELARRHPAVTVVRDVLYVADGRVLTSAGIASGIDLALHLVALDHGPAVAARTARSLVVPARRNGSAPQASAMLRHRDHLADVVHRAQDVLDARFTEALPLEQLAREVGVSARTLTRRFTSATGTTPLRYQQDLRVELADSLLGQGWTREAAAREVGFTDARMLGRLRAGS
jgi:transcriptional regulator GlxA family with amidase domain